MRTDDLTFGAELQARRKALYLTQVEAASVAGISVPSLTAWERGGLPIGRRSPALDRLLQAYDDLEARGRSGAPR
jgi:transcriptional regulator with XRE-family HTH domain